METSDLSLVTEATELDESAEESLVIPMPMPTDTPPFFLEEEEGACQASARGGREGSFTACAAAHPPARGGEEGARTVWTCVAFVVAFVVAVEIFNGVEFAPPLLSTSTPTSAKPAFKR